MTSYSIAFPRMVKRCKNQNEVRRCLTNVANILPLKFLITNFLAAPGLLFNSGEACLFRPLLGLVRAEKLALFWDSVIVMVESSLSFLAGCKLVGEFPLDFRFL